MSDGPVCLEPVRLEGALEMLARIAGGEHRLRLPISERRDHLDALACAVNGIADELVFQKETAENADRAKSQFLAMMSHEIRTPLSAVLGLCELLRDPSLTDSARADVLDRVRASGRVLLSIVDNVLDLSKLEAGKLSIERAPMSVRDCVREVLLCLEQSAREKGLGIASSVAAEVPERIEADPLRVRQVLTNLIANSIKFTSSGRISVDVAREGEMLRIAVTDTGIGIEAESQKLLFQSFQQADPSVTRIYGGSGLGLALGRRIARLMDGNLELARSAIGMGATFVLTLPLATKVTAPAITRRLDGVRVLLAEDSEELRFLYRGFLETEGASVAVAADGEEALRAAANGAFDLLLMDVNMPRLSGIEATRALRERGFRQPILALTAHALGTHEAECRSAGYDGSLYKPFYPDTLTETVIKAIGR